VNVCTFGTFLCLTCWWLIRSPIEGVGCFYNFAHFYFSSIVFIFSECMAYRPNFKMFVLHCYGSDVFRSVTVVFGQ